MKPDLGRKETEKKLTELEKRISKEYAQAEKELKEKLDKHFLAFAQKDAVKKQEVKAGKLSVEDYKKWRFGQMAIGKRWEDMRDTVAKDLANTTNIAKSISNGYMPDVYALNANYATFDIEKNIKMDTSFTMYSAESVERLMRDNPSILPPPGKRMTEKIRTGKAIKWEQKQVQSVLTQAIIQGESVPNISKRMANVLCVKDKKAAVRYARTAITEAENAGRLDSYKRAESMGIKLKKMWIASPDGHTRDWHVDLDGQTVRVEEPFTNKYGDIMYPGDGTADPLNVWNCRCTMVSQIEGFERDPSDLGLRPYNKLGGMSYDEWKRKKPNQTPLKNVYDAIKTAKEYSAEWHEKHNFNLDFWNNTLTDDERMGIQDYTGSYFRRMNKALREDDPSAYGDHIEKLITDCASGLDKCSIAEDTISYRGMGEPRRLAKALGIDEYDLANVVKDGSIIGQRFVEKGFCSTGVDSESGWDKPVMLEIISPKGTKGMYVDLISRNQGENELLLQKNTTFEILEVDTSRSKFDCEYLLKVLVVEQ